MNYKVYNLPKYQTASNRPCLLRIIVSDKYTRIDFGYQADPIYDHGGWITIAPNTYLHIKGTDSKLLMTKAENIPLEPEKKDLQSKVDSLYFNFYFPPLPQGISSFDLIEEEDSLEHPFNYYDIRLKHSSAIPLREWV